MSIWPSVLLFGVWCFWKNAWFLLSFLQASKAFAEFVFKQLLGRFPSYRAGQWEKNQRDAVKHVHPQAAFTTGTFFTHSVHFWGSVPSKGGFRAQGQLKMVFKIWYMVSAFKCSQHTYSVGGEYEIRVRGIWVLNADFPSPVYAVCLFVCLAALGLRRRCSLQGFSSCGAQSSSWCGAWTLELTSVSSCIVQA